MLKSALTIWRKELLLIVTNKSFSKVKNHEHKVNQLCLAGVFLALIFIFRIVSMFLGPFVFGYNLQLHYLPYILALIFISDWKYKLLVYLLGPVLLIIFVMGVNPVLDYMMTMYSFGWFMLLRKPNALTWKVGLDLVLLTTISFLCANWWNVLSGVVFYRVGWVGSLTLNSLFNLVNYVVILPLLLATYKIFSTIPNKQLTHEYTYQS